MSDNLMHFNITTDNEFWLLLKDSNQLHITARQKHASLLALCKERGVAFKDLEAHLLKEAKKCGLYRATNYNKVTKKMAYPAIKDLLKVGWYVCLSNFIRWAYKNYYDYDITSAERTKKIVKKSKAVVRNTTTGATRTLEVQGATIPEVTGNNALNVGSLGSFLNSPNPPSITRPIDATMSLSQVQAIILRNFAVLGKICEEHGPGAVECFNMLMVELGQEQECIEETSVSLSMAA